MTILPGYTIDITLIKCIKCGEEKPISDYSQMKYESGNEDSEIKRTCKTCVNKARKLIEELKKQGKTIILITHDIHLAWNYAERLIIMKDGKIEIDGPTDSIMRDEDKLRTCNITVPNSAKLYNKYLSLNKLN